MFVVELWFIVTSFSFVLSSDAFLMCSKQFLAGIDRGDDDNSYRLTTFLEFLETRKCYGIRLNSGKRPKVRERSGNLFSW